MKVVGCNRPGDIRGPAFDASAMRPDNGYAGARALDANHAVVAAFLIGTRQVIVPFVSVGLSQRVLHRPFEKVQARSGSAS